jgi:hypothetical protein
MKRVTATFIAIAMAFGIGVAFAQGTWPKWPGALTGIADYNGNQFSSVYPMASGPAAIKGFGTLTVAATSIAISGLTLGPNSAVWPATPGVIYFSNDISSGSNVLYVCPLGGTCGTNGIKLIAGQSFGVRTPATTATTYSPLGAVLDVQW